MTTDLALAYVESMPRARAQRLLDASTAAIARFQQPEWWAALESVANGDGDDGEAGQVATTRRRRQPLSINGQAMPVGHAKLMLAGALGDQFAEARVA